MSTDLAGELTFGESFKLLERGEKNQFAMDLERLPKLGMIGTALSMVIKLARRLPIPYSRDALQAGKRISAYAEKALMSYEALISQDPSNARPTLFTKLFHDAESADINIISEARGYIVGGSYNTAISLTYLVWAVSQHEEIRKVLLHELDSLPGPGTFGFGDHELKELPFLNQIVNETLLRLYATNSSNRPRNPPAPGVNLGGGYWIPNDITVSTQAYSLHRDTNIFPGPEKFDPWRWASPTPEMNRAFVPFGGGSRSKPALSLLLLFLFS